MRRCISLLNKNIYRKFYTIRFTIFQYINLVQCHIVALEKSLFPSIQFFQVNTLQKDHETSEEEVKEKASYTWGILFRIVYIFIEILIYK